MIHVIISIDPTTNFLFSIIDRLKENNVPLNIIEVNASDASYETAKEKIGSMPKSSTILFLGHGQSNQLYGGESETFKKKPLILLREMGLFEGQNLFLLACDSSQLLKSSFRLSGIKKSIGFGGLPTEMSEVIDDKKLASKGITEEIINEYRDILTENISKALIYNFSSDSPNFYTLKDYLCLLLNKKINELVLEKENRILSDLVFQMKSEIVIY